MSPVRRFDHVGITVADLDTVTAFFVGLGLEVEGTRMFVEGEFLDTVIGIPDSRTDIVMLRPPTEAPGWSSRASSGPITSPDRPLRWPTSWGYAASPSRSTTSRRRSTG
jgi:catechol 2,3-dioxygenase-like lactoylglutathione lyase family enzyme